MNKMKHLLLAALLLISHVLTAQFSVTFKPNGTVGQDAEPWRNDVCTNRQTSATGSNTEFGAIAWTWYSENCGPGNVRSIVRFDELNTLPAGAVITYAELRLFGLASSTNIQGSSYYPGSPYPNDNSAWIRRVTAAWAENVVTWNTQPSFTTVDQVAVPASTTQWNYNVALNVTSMVSAMMAPGSNNGFLLMLQNENYYRSLLFASSDYPDATRWPELYIRYEIPCNAKFTYAASMQNPGTYDFSVNNPQTGFTYTWDFGDGTTGAGNNVSHNYALGTYQVCLNTYNESTGMACKQCMNICVQNNSQLDTCSVKFSFDKINASLVQFYGLASGANPVISALWDFGDGTTSSAWPNVQHQYAQSGTYKVCVKVKYENGCEARYCYQVEIGSSTCDVSFTSGANKFGTLFRGFAQAGLTVASALWSFGDGTYSTTWSAVSHNYAAAGYYTVCLDVTYTNGCTARYCMQIYSAGGGIQPMDERQSSSLKRIHTTNSIEVIPNPISSSLINVKLNIEQAGLYGYSILDAQGKKLYGGNKLLNKGEQVTQIPIKNIKVGNYWIVFTNGKKQIRTGFIKI